jgi:hypothetical protein
MDEGKSIIINLGGLEDETNRVLKNSGEFPTWRKEEVK